MKILVLADAHGDIEKTSKILDTIDLNNTDLILCSGDFVDESSVPQGFSVINIIDVFIQKLIALGKPTFCIPGNMDPLEIIDVFEEYGVNVHNTTKTFKDVVIVGWGGALTPFNTTFEPSETETKHTLDKLGSGVRGDFILFLHNPPKNTTLDVVGDKHVGSQAERVFIEKKQPLLVLSSHIHESIGTDKINKSTIFYPGPISGGYYGIVEIRGKTVTCTTKRIT